MVKSPMLWITALVLVLLASPAGADTVRLSNKGEVAGSLTELTLRLGPIEKTFPRNEIVSVAFEKKRCQVQSTDGTKYIGKLESVVVRSDTGELTFTGDSVTAITLGEEPAAGRPEDKDDQAAAEDDAGAVLKGLHLAEPGKEEKAPLTPEQEKRAEELIQKAAELRDAALVRVDQAAAAEYDAIKSQYFEKWKAACEEAESRQVEYDKFVAPGAPVETSGASQSLRRPLRAAPRTGLAAGAYEALSLSEARRNKLAEAIRTRQLSVKDRTELRKDRIQAYFSAIRRYLAAGNELPEDSMERIFDKAMK